MNKAQVNQIHKNGRKFQYYTKEENVSGMLSNYTLMTLS